MAKSKTKEFDEYRYGPKSVLRPGDRFRATGGHVYVANDGEAIPMYDRGVFVFRRYCEKGAEKWVEAWRADKGGMAVLWVGRSMQSPIAPGLRRRPYRITRKLKPGEPASRGRQARRAEALRAAGKETFA